MVQTIQSTLTICLIPLPFLLIMIVIPTNGRNLFICNLRFYYLLKFFFNKREILVSSFLLLFSSFSLFFPSPHSHSHSRSSLLSSGFLHAAIRGSLTFRLVSRNSLTRNRSVTSFIALILALLPTVALFLFQEDKFFRVQDCNSVLRMH
jgi:hypothetical protein